METPDKVVLLGRAVGCLAYKECIPTHEIWTCFSATRVVEGKIDLVFDPHPMNFFEKDPLDKKVMDRVKKESIPIFLQEVHPEYPSSMKYPLKEIVDKFGMAYFSNSFCYMIAYAVYIGVKQLDLYGANMLYEEEYRNQKGGVEFWLGFAMGSGLKVRAFGRFSQLLKTKSGRLYGYDYDENLK